MQQPLITIGITCFNAADTIGRALESALAQDWRNKEILVVDDSSTDESVRIVEEYAAQNDNISLVRHSENGGCAVTRNTILEHAKGEYLAFFDDDDVSYPSRISEQYSRLIDYECDTDLVFCHCSWETTTEEANGEILHITKGIGRHPKEPHGEMVSRRLLFGSLVSLPGSRKEGYVWGGLGTLTMMARRESFERVGRFDTCLRRHEDWDLAIRAGMMGCHFISVDKILMRQYKTGGTDKTAATVLKQRMKIIRKYKSHYARRHLWLYACIMARAGAHEFVGNKWPFKLYRSLAKRVARISRLVYGDQTDF